jgi:hypothetical protein
VVLSPGAGIISTLFHVVFDDLFTIVPSIDTDNDPPEHWEELCLESSTHIMLDSPPDHLNDDWLPEEELEIKRHHQNHDERIREVTEKTYGSFFVLNHARASSVTGPSEVPSDTPTRDGQSEDPSSSGITPRISNRFKSTHEIEVVVTTTKGVSTPTGGGQLQLSDRSTAGKFQPA